MGGNITNRQMANLFSHLLKIYHHMGETKLSILLKIIYLSINMMLTVCRVDLISLYIIRMLILASKEIEILHLIHLEMI